jgi:hypothetical protein
MSYIVSLPDRATAVNLDEQNTTTVCGDDLIMRDKVQGFKPRLRDQRAVERVAMVIWQACRLSKLVVKAEARSCVGRPAPPRQWP